jgi:hypothetical protein
MQNQRRLLHGQDSVRFKNIPKVLGKCLAVMDNDKKGVEDIKEGLGLADDFESVIKSI